MKEFILDLGGPDGAAIFDSLDEFTQGYVECLFFASGGPEGDLEGATVADLAPETVEKIIRNCERFQRRYKVLLTKAYRKSEETYRGPVPYTPKHAGHDFCYTRNGHGTGFWDRGLGDVGDGLAAACGDSTPFSSEDPYMGGDGRIYLS